MAAAIGDFRVKSVESEKISRTKKNELTLHLKSNRDISADLGRAKSNQFLVCFSLEMPHNEKKAEDKMIKKGCDMMVYNEVDSSLGKDTSKITLMFPQKKPVKFDTMDKRECAWKIMLNIAEAMDLLNG
jgi:phosphopantothenoylcysteine decarboxylase/phosphopantothenate--cysteine ligase